MRLVIAILVGICACAVGYVLCSFAVFIEANRNQVAFLAANGEQVVKCRAGQSLRCWIAYYAPEIYAYGGLFLMVVGVGLTLRAGISFVHARRRGKGPR